MARQPRTGRSVTGFRVPVAVAIGLAVALSGCTAETAAGSASSSPARSGSAAAGSEDLDQAALDQALRTAAWANDVAEARRLIAQGADVNAKDDTVQSAYLIATSEGYDELLALTLHSGAKVNDKDSWNGTGLIRAAERGHYLVVGRLLAAGIDKDHVNRIGYQAIHEAVWLGADQPAELATVNVLIAGGVQLDRPSGTERLTPRQMASERGYRSLAAALVVNESRVVIAGAPGSGAAAVRDAVARGEATALAYALRDGGAADLGRGEERDLLATARTAGHDDVVRLLEALFVLR